LNIIVIEYYANTLFRQKFYKLKKESEALLATNGTGTAPAASPTTTQTKAASSTIKTSTGKRARKPKDANAAGVGDDDAGETPSKKMKTEKVVKKEKIVENGNAEDEDGESSLFLIHRYLLTS
jgi:hypothetical protein